MYCKVTGLKLSALGEKMLIKELIHLLVTFFLYKTYTIYI